MVLGTVQLVGFDTVVELFRQPKEFHVMPSANYKHLKKFDPATNEGKRLPPQLQTILDSIEAAGKEGISQDELVKKLSEGNKLNTRQPVDRVINFYHQRMKDLGLVDVQKTSSATKTVPSSTTVVGDPAAKPQNQQVSPAQQVGSQQVAGKAPV